MITIIIPDVTITMNMIYWIIIFTFSMFGLFVVIWEMYKRMAVFHE